MTEQITLATARCFVLAAFLVAILDSLRRRRTNHSSITSRRHVGSTFHRYIPLHYGLLIVLVLVAVSKLGDNDGTRNEAWCAVGGALAVIIGISLVLSSRKSLGPLWTPDSFPVNEKTAVSSGAFRWLRHPGYVGQSVAALGSALAFSSFLLCCSAIVLTLYNSFRASVERTSTSLE